VVLSPPLPGFLQTCLLLAFMYLLPLPPELHWKGDELCRLWGKDVQTEDERVPALVGLG